MGLFSNRLFSRKRTINLALQGGGAHGAFTWGVLDRLLEEEDLEFGWISATSAGSVNAVAMASGWVAGGREGARESLKTIWKAIYDAGVPELLRMNPFLHSLSRSPTLARVAGLWSPYDLNPLGFNPLRQLLVEKIDFEKLRSKGDHELLVAATDVATGQPRLFRRHELKVDCVLASACLPTAHHAVEVDGRAYWDGGFSANPDIVTLASESPVSDTMIVQLNPLVRSRVPTGVNEISEHISNLTFNAPMRRDVELIVAARKMSADRFGRARGSMSALVNHRFHLIEAGHFTGSLSPQTKLKPDWGLFTYLHEAGRIKTERWLQNSRVDVGRRSTIDLEDHFLRRPMIDVRDEAIEKPGGAGVAAGDSDLPGQGARGGSNEAQSGLAKTVSRRVERAEKRHAKRA